MGEPVRIGLCGRSGSGKGYVSHLFAEFGIPAIDTDAVYREMTAPAAQLSPCMAELVDTFGEAIALPDHSLNRRALADIVFSEQGTEARQTLNRITHTHILTETERRVAALGASGVRYVIIDAPLLFESGFDAMCRFTVCVLASDETSVARIVQRDGISEADAYKRLKTQLSVAELQDRCDYSIENDLHSETLRQQVETIVCAMRRAVGDAL